MVSRSRLSTPKIYGFNLMILTKTRENKIKLKHKYKHAIPLKSHKVELNM